MRQDLFSIIGVVTSTKPITQTRSKGRILLSAFIVGSLFAVVTEWCRNFAVADSSCIEEGILTYNLKVNCFQKKRIEWLPQAEFGDIVIFRDLKVSSKPSYQFALTHPHFLRLPRGTEVLML
jgi:hypothetical protein